MVGVEFHAEVVETSEPDGQGMTTSTLRIRCDANTSAEGRYGELTLEPTDGVGYSTSYAVYQFGTGLSFDEENRLDLAARGEVEFDVQAPSEAIVGVTCPTWVTYTPGTDDGETVTYTFSVGENPSDTKTEREATIELSIRDVSAKTELPVIRQAFYPAGGIVSGAGLKMFAETFNAGGRRLRLDLRRGRQDGADTGRRRYGRCRVDTCRDGGPSVRRHRCRQQPFDPELESRAAALRLYGRGFGDRRPDDRRHVETDRQGHRRG